MKEEEGRSKVHSERMVLQQDRPSDVITELRTSASRGAPGLSCAVGTRDEGKT